MNQEEVSKANKLYDEGSMSKLYDFIKPFLDKDDPYAFSFYSRFSLSEWNESDEENDARYVDCLAKAAEGNVPEAMYRLSTLYSVGDIVQLNIEKGKHYMESALKLGYSPAKLTLGLYLFYGANGYQKDLGRAAELINQAEDDNVEGADEALKLLEE